jgi:hypothetical protein
LGITLTQSKAWHVQVSGTTNALAFTTAVSSGGCVIVYIVYDDTATISSIVDDKGNSYAVKNTIDDATDNMQVSQAVLGNITNGPTTITATFTGTIFNSAVSIAEWAGVSAVADPSDVFGGQAVNAATSLTSGNVTTTVDGDLISGLIVGASSNAALVIGSGFTDGQNSATYQTSTAYIDWEWEIQATHGAVAATWTRSTATNYAASVLAIKAAAGAAVAAVLGGSAKLYSQKLGPQRRFKPQLAFPAPAASTAALLARSLSAAFGGATLSGKTPLAARAASSSFAKPSILVTVPIAAKAAAQTAARATASAKAALAATTLSAAKSTAGIAGKTSLAARSAAQSFARGGISAGANLQALASAAVSQLKGRAGISASAALTGMAGAAALARGGLKAMALISAKAIAVATGASAIAGKTALLARTSITSAMKAALTATAFLAAQATAQAKGGSTFSGKVSLAAKATAAAFGRLIQPGAIALLARAFGKMVGGGTLQGVLSLQARAQAQSAAAPGIKAATLLSGVSRAAASSRSGIAATVRLASSSVAASFARGTMARNAALSGLAGATSSARSAIIGKLQLAARAEARSFARGNITAVAPMIALAGRTLVMLTARALLYLFEPSPRVAAVPYESRVASAPTEPRVVAVQFESRVVAVSTIIIAGQAMAVIWPNKDPAEIADFDLDWPPRLGVIDTVQSSTWLITATDSPVGTPIAIQSSSFIPTRTKVWLTGGNPGFTYSLENTVVTANGDHLVQTAKVLIKKK